jgi:hypothetical protein
VVGFDFFQQLPSHDKKNKCLRSVQRGSSEVSYLFSLDARILHIFTTYLLGTRHEFKKRYTVHSIGMKAMAVQRHDGVDTTGQSRDCY